MKVIAKPIEMVAWFDMKGEPHPVRFRVSLENDELKTIKIDKVIAKDKERLAGNYMLKFTCQSNIGGIQKAYEIKYELESCKWMLFKM